MSTSKVSLWSLVFVPAILTLLVTVVRLVGELQGWSSTLFSAEAGGGGSLIGISWLVPVFGLWFGSKLRRTTGEPVKLTKSLLIYLAALAVFAGGMFALVQLDLIQLPSEEKPGKFGGMPYMLTVMGLAAIVSLFAWPRLTLALMVYGVLARLPVVVVTYFDVYRGWDTHYGKLPPGALVDGSDERFQALIMAQVSFWPFVYTAVIGGIFGCIGASLAGKKR